MNLAALLEQAVRAKVVLAIGQRVIVRTKKGADVTRGIIRNIHPELGVIRVQDLSGGSDLQVDVGTKNYDFFVQTDDDTTLPLTPFEIIVHTRAIAGAYSLRSIR